MTTAVSLAQSVAPGVSLGFKNRIINGGMVIDQRNAGASVTPTAATGVYITDRFAAYQTAASKFTVQQNAGSVTPPVGFTKYLGFTSSSSYSSGSTEFFMLYQCIEGLNCIDLAFGTINAKTVTLSFQVYSSLTGTFSGSLQNNANDRSYPFTYTVSSANTWTSVSVTVPGDTTGTWTTDNTCGLQVNWDLGCGSTRRTTAGAWASGGNYKGVTGAVSVVGTSGATFYITGVQLEVGTAATPFEFRDYGRELIMCQRYYEKSFDMNVAPASGAYEPDNRQAIAYGTSNARSTAGLFKVTKRAVPTMTIYTPTNYGGLSAGNVAAIYVGGTWYAATSSTIVTSEIEYYWEATRSSAYTTGYAYLCAAGWSASAEL